MEQRGREPRADPPSDLSEADVGGSPAPGAGGMDRRPGAAPRGGRLFRSTVRQQIFAGLGIIALTGALATVVAYRGLGEVSRALRQVANVSEPISAAAYEMEINVIGTGMGVLKYLETGDPRYRARVLKDQADFRRFKGGYDALADSPQSKELGAKVARLYDEYVGLGGRLMDDKDRQRALFSVTIKGFDSIDRILDDKIQAKIDAGARDGGTKLLVSQAARRLHHGRQRARTGSHVHGLPAPGPGDRRHGRSGPRPGRRIARL